MNHAIHPKPEGLDRLPVELLRKVPLELFENIPEDFMETLHQMIGSRAFESEELKQGLKEQVEGILKQTLIVSSGKLPESSFTQGERYWPTLCAAR